MKKINFVIFVYLLVVAIPVSAHYYENNPDYEFIGAGNGGTWYLYLKSIDVQEYNPPHYQIAGDFIYVNGDGSERTNKRHILKRYDWNKKETYHCNDYGIWLKDEVNDKNMASVQVRIFANALFRAAYGMNFYDN